MKLAAWKLTARVAVTSLVAAFGCAAIAQSAPPVATLRAGTPVTLVFLNDISSADAAVGTTVPFVLANNLTADGAIAIKGGTKAFAKVTMVLKARPAGRSGALTLQLEPLRVDGKIISLRAYSNGSDVHYQRPYHLKFPMGVFRTGDDVEIRSGTLLTVFVAEDVQLPAFD